MVVGTGEEVLVLGGGVGKPGNQSIPDRREILPREPIEGAGDGGGPIRSVAG